MTPEEYLRQAAGTVDPTFRFDRLAFKFSIAGQLRKLDCRTRSANASGDGYHGGVVFETPEGEGGYFVVTEATPKPQEFAELRNYDGFRAVVLRYRSARTVVAPEGVAVVSP